MSGDPMLTIDDLHSGYGPIEALKGVSLTVGRGEIVTLIGANGAGKTTTLMCVSGVNVARRGRIVFDGGEIQNTRADAIVRMGLTQSPEGRKIFPRLTVLENLMMGAYTRRDKEGMAEDLEKVFAMFPILRDRRAQTGGTLSGGEQQMLAIGRALMSRPRMLLLDEPSMGVAPLLTLKIFEVIQELNRGGMTILLVEQNARLALKIAHRGYVLETGKIVLADRAQALLTHPRVREAYLGES